MTRRRSSLVRVPRARLERTAAPLESVSALWLLVVVAPVGLPVFVITAGFVATGGADPGVPPPFPLLVYAGANVVVLGGVFLAWTDDRWQVVALFRHPSRSELGAGMLATAVGVAIGWPATTLVAEAVGVPRYAPPTVTTSVGLVAVVVGAVVVAPIAEEILYRGVFVGIGLSRGYRPLIVGAGSLLVFATIHVFTAGVAGVVNAFLLGALLTWLRLRSDNLVGAWLFHALNNLLELLVALAVFPSLYAV